MPRRRIPKYRHFKPKNLGLVVLNGKQFYLGTYGSSESVAEYNRLIQEWLANGHAAPPTRPDRALTPQTVNELILAFWTQHAETHYRLADGTPSPELENYRHSIRLFRQLYGHTVASEFGPKDLKTVRRAMIDSGLARGTINQRVGRILHLFKWAVENELVPPEMYHGLKAVSGLRKGRTDARETAPVKPVPDECVDAIQPHVARQVWAMIQLQRLTGMRPGEVTTMRTCDLDTSGTVWIYTPQRHKTEHLGQQRSIYLGPRAQAIVRAWLRAEPTAYLFSPLEAMAEFRREQRRKRKTPLYPSQRARGPQPNPKRTLGDHYSTRSYGHAVGYGCKRAGVPHWHPHQLRHNAATSLRREFGLEVARIILGHRSPAVTEIYAELDRDKALDVAEQVG